jgi:hypothetical protein
MWAALIQAGAALIGGAMASKGNKDQTKTEIKAQKEIVGLQGLEDRRNLEYQAQLANYYDMMSNQRKAKAFAGLARHAGGTGNVAEAYSGEFTAPTVGGLTPITGTIPAQQAPTTGGLSRAG